MNNFYEYLGKSTINVKPLVDYLTTSFIPLYEDADYRNKICSLRTKQSIATGYPPVFLDENWQPERQDTGSTKNFWCLPFRYSDEYAMFVLGGPGLLSMFPDVFSPTDVWNTKLEKFLDRAQIIVTNGNSSKHKDVGNRVSSINTYLYNTDKSVTEFWTESEKVGEIVYNPGDSYLLNIRQLHKITQKSKGTRCVLSWGYFIPFERSLNEIRLS